MMDGQGRRIRKRAWNSHFTGGFGKRSPGRGIGGVRPVPGDGDGAEKHGRLLIPLFPLVILDNISNNHKKETI